MKKAVHEGLLFCVVKRQHKNTDGIRAFAMGYHIFYESAESVSLPRRRGVGGENQEPVYRDS